MKAELGFINTNTTYVGSNDEKHRLLFAEAVSKEKVKKNRIALGISIAVALVVLGFIVILRK